MVQCAPESDAPDARVELRFTHRGQAGDSRDTIASHWLDAETLAAVVNQEAPRFWDGHILTLDLPEERGGALLIANWNGQQFVISEYRYQTGDEDGMQLAWQDGGFLVTTVPDDQRRLLATIAADGTPGAYAQEALSCSHGAQPQARHGLRLALDTSGRITGVEYDSTTPAPDGTVYVCSVQASRSDGQSAWQASANGDLQVTFADDDSADPGSRPEQPDRLRLSHRGDSYTFDLDLFQPRFCGQSSVMAKTISLERGSSQCSALVLPD